MLVMCLSYYVDDSLKESLMLYAEDKKNVLALSEYLGYKPKVTSPAIANLAVYQVVPSTGTGRTEIKPDSRYYLKNKRRNVCKMQVKQATIFRTTEILDFADST